MDPKSRAYARVRELSQTLADAYEKPGSPLRPEDRDRLAACLPGMARLVKKRVTAKAALALCDALLAVTADN